jgi:hypothetical protein
LVGVSGSICTVSWRTFGKWNELHVVMEHHYDQQQSGEPLTHDDLRFDAPEAAIEFSKGLANGLGGVTEARRGF